MGDFDLIMIFCTYFPVTVLFTPSIKINLIVHVRFIRAGSTDSCYTSGIIDDEPGYNGLEYSQLSLGAWKKKLLGLRYSSSGSV
jgi:hypothetical protein